MTPLATSTLNQQIEQTRQLLSHLQRGGAYAYYWTVDQEQTYTIQNGPNAGKTAQVKRTRWYPVNGKIPPAPNGKTKHIYFGVHPAIGIPEERKNGKGEVYKPKPEYTRPLVTEIAAVNCLFGEYDAKHFADGKPGALNHIERLPARPSTLIDSGGGNHCYWLLDKPFIIDTPEKRAYIKDLQNRWVQFIGSDEDAKDLARVLRVPGRRNIKPDYGPNYPVVSFVYHQPEVTYTIEELAALIPECIKPESEREPFERREGDHSAYVAAAYNGEIAAVRSALDGQKHYTVRNAAIKLAGLLWTDCITEDEIMNGIYSAVESRARDTNAAKETILDGIAYGKANPRTIKERPIQNDSTQQSDTTPQATQATQSSAFKFYRGTEIDHITAPRQLVRGYLSVGTVAMMIAPSEAGKSTIAVDLANKVAQHYGVLYVAAEDASNVRTQIRAWELAHSRQRAGNLTLHDGPIDLNNDMQIGAFIVAARELTPRLVIFDTLSACIPGLDENSSEMSLVTYNLNRIADELSAAVLVLHHPLKYDGGTFRGHSSLMNNTHTLIVVSREPGDDIITLSVTRHKGTRATPTTLRLLTRPTDIIDPDDGALSAPIVLPAARIIQDATHLSVRQKAILQYLNDVDGDGGATSAEISREIANQFKTTEGRVRTDIASLVKRGYMTAGEKQRDPRKITSKGSSAIKSDQVDQVDQDAPLDPFEINTRLAEPLAQTTNPIASVESYISHQNATSEKPDRLDRNPIAPDRDQVLSSEEKPDHLIDSFRIDQVIGFQTSEETTKDRENDHQTTAANAFRVARPLHSPNINSISARRHDDELSQIAADCPDN